jgi:hypothetical protein
MIHKLLLVLLFAVPESILENYTFTTGITTRWVDSNMQQVAVPKVSEFPPWTDYKSITVLPKCLSRIPLFKNIIATVVRKSSHPQRKHHFSNRFHFVMLDGRSTMPFSSSRSLNFVNIRIRRVA